MDILDVVNLVLLWGHFFGLVLGMGSGMALSVVAPAIGKAPPESRESLWNIQGALSRNVQAGLGLLIVTGIILVFSRYGGIAEMSIWFWVKMALVVVLLVSVTMGTRAARRVKAGDISAMPTAKRAGMINGVTGILIILSAVLAFE